jgi:hypothetical protein
VHLGLAVEIMHGCRLTVIFAHADSPVPPIRTWSR